MFYCVLKRKLSLIYKLILVFCLSRYYFNVPLLCDFLYHHVFVMFTVFTIISCHCETARFSRNKNLLSIHDVSKKNHSNLNIYLSSMKLGHQLMSFLIFVLGY